MTILLASSSTVNSSSITVSSLQLRDCIVCFASNPASTTIPDLPTDWINLVSISTASGSFRAGYIHSSGTSNISSTWTNAQNIIAGVWRADTTTIAVPERISSNSGTSVNILYPAQTTNTFRTNAASTALYGYVQNANLTNTLLPPGALANDKAASVGSSQFKTYYQENRTTAWSSTTVVQAASAAFLDAIISIFEVNLYNVGGGGSSGLFLPIGFTGGMNE